MVKRYLAVLLLIPLADALLLVALASVFPWEVIVLLVVLTGLLGLLFVRAEGRHTVRRFQTRLADGELPTDELLDGAMLVAAGAFFLTPGLVTDALAVLLVVPLTRYPIRALVKRIARPYVDRKTGGFVSGTVYTGGFPSEGEAGAGQPDGGDVFELDEDAYDVDVEDDE